ncbi:MAG: Rv3235 family protein [Sporichthyaceae bacterium]
MSSAHALRPSQVPAPRATPLPRIPRQRSTSGRNTPLDAGAEASAEAAATVIAQALIEVLTGRRTAAQLRGCATPGVVAAVAARAPGPTPAQRRTVVPLPRVRLCHPRTGVAEVAVVIAGAHRARALAFRLEHHHGRWICTAVAVG